MHPARLGELPRRRLGQLRLRLHTMARGHKLTSGASVMPDSTQTSTAVAQLTLTHQQRPGHTRSVAWPGSVLQPRHSSYPHPLAVRNLLLTCGFSAARVLRTTCAHEASEHCSNETLSQRRLLFFLHSSQHHERSHVIRINMRLANAAHRSCVLRTRHVCSSV